jgi:hypothetical protein
MRRNNTCFICRCETVKTDNDPCLVMIAAEMLDVGMALMSKAALQVIEWWDSYPENLKRSVIAYVGPSNA